jgi:imidazole glycerol-phosphate synthase subunit HisH
MIAVVSYGVSNVGSMLSMLRKIGAQAEPVSDPAGLARAERIILPGVGAFDQGMAALRRLGLADAIRQRVMRDGVPILGVCLGMQLLGEGSEEGDGEGLGMIGGRCVRFQSMAGAQIKVPHMGWNVLTSRRESPLLAGLDARARFYFVHSYHLVCADPADVLATATHGVAFTAMVERGNVRGAQFHPEKSHRFGMTLLANFAKV